MSYLTPLRLIAAACLLFALTVAALVALRPLMPVDETRYVTVAWEMWLGGSKAVPHLNGELYSHKPPLLFWMIDLVWLVTGVSELAARAITPIFGIIAVALTGGLARRLWPETPERAGLAALILASTGFFLFYGSTTMFDVMQSVAVLAAVWALLGLRRAAGLRPTLALGAAIALGVYAKGPVILVHVAPLALLMPFWADRATRPPLAQWYGRLALALAVALGLVALWLGPALVLGGPDYRADVLWRQSAGRMVSSFAHGRPWWFFLALSPMFLWPWGWARGALAQLSPARLLDSEQGRLLAIWILSTALAFSAISGKQVHYLVPELPAVALLLSGMGSVAAGALWRRLLPLIPTAVLFLLITALALRLVPDEKADGMTIGLGAFLAAAVLFAALVLAAAKLEGGRLYIALIAPGTLLMLHLAVAPVLARAYDPTIIGGLIAPYETQGIALTDTNYHGQFTFAGRLTRPITLVTTPEAQADWVASHPGGVLLTQVETSDAALNLLDTRRFHGKTYYLYQTHEAPQ